MTERLIAVLDVGKTMAKLSLWTPSGAMLARQTRANTRLDSGPYVALDLPGIDAWIGDTLCTFSKMGRLGAIMPVGHGAAAVVMRDGQVACPPPDYEEPIPDAIRQSYDEARDPFSQTGSPRLPDGLNLGAQLHYLAMLYPGLLGPGAQILLWPQYWAWRLCGVAAAEVTSLGCHSDLWNPRARAPSLLATQSGWADCLPPVRRADEVLGLLSPEWIRRCGLPDDVAVHCGLHDSNAALIAARGFPEIANAESTVLSTGTWFVAMRSPADDRAVDPATLSEARDCLINVDAFGKLVPSSRFMGGREIELLTGVDSRRIDIVPDQPALVAAVPEVIRRGARVLPCFAPGFGPFPQSRGRWIDMPTDPAERRAAVSLYAALVADVSLGLIGARDNILVEGRFAEAQVFVRALASLRPDATIYVSNAHNDVSYGAMRLLQPSLRPTDALTRVAPLEISLDAYRSAWTRDTERLEHAA